MHYFCLTYNFGKLYFQTFFHFICLSAFKMWSFLLNCFLHLPTEPLTFFGLQPRKVWFFKNFFCYSLNGPDISFYVTSLSYCMGQFHIWNIYLWINHNFLILFPHSFKDSIKSISSLVRNNIEHHWLMLYGQAFCWY